MNQITEVKTIFPFLSKKIVTQSYEEKNSIEVTKGRNGEYSWVIKVYGTDVEKIIDEIEVANKKLMATFKNG